MVITLHAVLVNLHYTSEYITTLFNTSRVVSFSPTQGLLICHMYLIFICANVIHTYTRIQQEHAHIVQIFIHKLNV